MRKIGDEFNALTVNCTRSRRPGRQWLFDIPRHRKAVARHGRKDEFCAAQYNYGHSYRRRDHAPYHLRAIRGGLPTLCGVERARYAPLSCRTFATTGRRGMISGNLEWPLYESLPSLVSYLPRSFCTAQSLASRGIEVCAWTDPGRVLAFRARDWYHLMR